MTYESTMKKITEAEQATSLLDAIHLQYAKQASVALALLDTPANRKAVKRASNTNVTQRNIVELFLAHLIASGDTVKPLAELGGSIRRMQEVKSEQTKLLERKKYAMKQLQVTQDSGVEIRTLSVGKNTIMVTAKTAGMKHPVTRHLRKQGGSIWTGRPLIELGESVFIQYHVTDNTLDDNTIDVFKLLYEDSLRIDAA